MLLLFCVWVKYELPSFCTSLFCAFHFMVLYWHWGGVKKWGRVQRAWPRLPPMHIIGFKCISKQLFFCSILFPFVILLQIYVALIWFHIRESYCISQANIIKVHKQFSQKYKHLSHNQAEVLFYFLRSSFHTEHSFLPQEGMKDHVAHHRHQCSATCLQQTHRCLRLYIFTKQNRSKKKKKSSVKIFFRLSHILWLLIICSAVSGNSSDFSINDDTKKLYHGTEWLYGIYKILQDT